jgi:hypothetical protein
MTKEQILLEVETSKFQPEFEFTKNLDDVVDNINKPHEDYFLGLNSKVKEIIEKEIEYANTVENYQITFADVCNWQKELFKYKQKVIGNLISKFNQDSNQELGNGYRFVRSFQETENDIAIKCKNLPNQHINLGLRQTNVKVGQWTPPTPTFLEDLKKMCFPISTGKVTVNCENSFGFVDSNEIKEYLTEWYKTFQTIHFFEDFNGRLGGVVINILSYILTEKYLIRSFKNKENEL